MKRVFLTLVIGLMTMVGYSQVVEITVTKMQIFEHPNYINTQDADAQGLMTYLSGGYVNGVFTFDLNNQIMIMKGYDKNNVLLVNRKYQIIENFKTSNLVDVLVKNPEGEVLLFVLGTTIADGSYVLISNKKVGNKIDGTFYPEAQVKVTRP